MLYKWGPVSFEVFPTNVSEVDHTTATDWSRKEIAGAANYREWVGEGDEEIHLRGKVFPAYFANALSNRGQDSGRGGLNHLDTLDNMRRMGQAHLLMRGDGVSLGWFVIDRFSRAHSMIDANGIGQQIAFEAVFERVPVPDAGDYIGTFWSATSGNGVG